MSGITERQLIQTTTQRCNYYHYRCKTFYDRLVGYIQQGNQPTIAVLLSFFRNTVIESYNCYKRRPDLIVSLFDYIDPTPELWQVMAKTADFEAICLRLKARGYRFESIDLKPLLTIHYYNKKNIDTNIIKLLQYTEQEITADDISLAIKNKLFETVRVMIFDLKGPYNLDHLKALIPFKVPYLTQLFSIGLQPDLEVLELVCANGHYEMIKSILQFRITPSKQALHHILTAGPRYYTKGKKKIVRHSYGGRLTEAQINVIIEMMVADGLVLSFDSVAYALKKRVKIDHLSRYGIEYDAKLMAECHRSDFYPYNFDAIQDIHCLRALCSNPNGMTEIKKLIKSGIKPDHRCLENAVKANNHLLVQYLIRDVSPNIDVLNDIRYHIGNGLLNCLIDKLVPRYQEIEKENQRLKKELEILKGTELIQLEESDQEQNQDQTVDTETIVEEKVENKPKFKPKKKKIGMSTLSKEERKQLKKQKKESRERKELDKQKRMTKKQEQTKTQEFLDFSEENLEFPTNLKKEKPLKKTTLAIFKLPNTTQMSYLQLRNALLQMIISEKMFDPLDETRIELNKELKKASKIKQNGCLRFVDLDHLVMRLWQ